MLIVSKSGHVGYKGLLCYILIKCCDWLTEWVTWSNEEMLSHLKINRTKTLHYTLAWDAKICNISLPLSQNQTSTSHGTLKKRNELLLRPSLIPSQETILDDEFFKTTNTTCQIREEDFRLSLSSTTSTRKAFHKIMTQQLTWSSISIFDIVASLPIIMAVIAELTLHWKQNNNFLLIEYWNLLKCCWVGNFYLRIKKRLPLRRVRVALALDPPSQAAPTSESEWGCLSVGAGAGPWVSETRASLLGGTRSRQQTRMRSVSGWALISGGGDDANINVY